jgi:translocation and assembly module TamB
MTRRRVAIAAAALVALAALVVLAGVLVVQSSWFYGKVRQRIVTTIADATGGRVSIGGFRFDWKTMRAEVRNFVLIGAEPAGKPPLVRADSVTVGLKIVSILKRDVDILSLDVQRPRVYLIVYPNGDTNLPEPKVKGPYKDPIESVLKFAVDRINVSNGIFEIESRKRTPFDLHGDNLTVALSYDRLTPSYRGDVAVQRITVDGVGGGLGASLNASVEFRKNHIGIRSARITAGDSLAQVTGVIEDLQSPHGTFQYDTRFTAVDAGRLLNVKLLDRGMVESAGSGVWQGGPRFTLTGSMHGYNLDYRGAYVQLRGFRTDGTVSADPDSIRLSGLRISGAVAGRINTTIGGEVAHVALRGSDLTLQGIALGILGGTFRGDGRVRDFQQFDVNGAITGIEARRAVALYSTAPLPWNSRLAGTVKLDGRFQRKDDFRAAINLTLEPAPDSAPVHGQIAATYDARAGVVDLGRSTVTLPSSSAEVTGAIGRELRVHLATHDLNDLLPVLGKSAATLPVKFDGGNATFDGVVTGAVDDPHAAGHLTASNFLIQGEKVDTLAADVTASKGNVQLQNATVSRGGLRAQFQTAMELHDWKIDDDSLIDGVGSIHNAGVTQLAELLKANQVAATGTLDGTAKWNGTLGKPIVAADVTVAKGSFDGEPFDGFSSHLTYSAQTLAANNAQLTAGAKQVRLTASYTHTEDRLDTGHLRFQVATNAMPVETIETIRKERSDASGTLQVTGNGALDLIGKPTGAPDLRVADLHADVTANSLKIDGQQLGVVHVTANSQGQMLRAHLESEIAGSAVKGDGEWRLEGDYPGSGTVTFARTDLAQLRAWISSSKADQFRGWLEGQLRIAGPLLNPRAVKAELRVTSLEVSPAPSTGVPVEPLTLHNSGPVVATLANSIVTIDSLRLVGHDTDLTVSGRVLLDQKSPLDLKVGGHVDLGIVQTLNRDFRASGQVNADATVRGAFAAPQISGRTEFHNATFYVADLPNGLSNANAVILFTGDRATIQSFSGETGGGKVDLFGFAGYGEGGIVFRLHARVTEVRVRYPEGVSTVGNASLNLTGTTDRSMLSGTITILRTGFNPQSDFSSIIAQSAQPVQTPAARAGFLGGLNFDVQISTAPDIQFQSSLTQDLEVEANLRLRGTATNPALLGRVNVTQGQIVFFGTRYRINQGTVSFYNPVRVEPVLNLDLETKARGIDITLSITGPLNKLTMTPRSDPPLQFNEIVALLATGRAPTNDPTLLAQQNTAPQSWQQMGASALLGQAIASPVAGRLQRFFGVSRLRIDPSLPGVESIPQARLTFVQQVTQDITFTYITNVTSSNPQVVQVEWAFSKRWSVVALREENGMFGIDFFFKRRF